MSPTGTSLGGGRWTDRGAGFRPKLTSSPTDGDPLGFRLTDGEGGDGPHFETLLDLGRETAPHAAVGDEGYDSTAIRTAPGPNRSQRSFPKPSIADGLASSRSRENASASSALRCAAEDGRELRLVVDLSPSSILIKAVQTAWAFCAAPSQSQKLFHAVTVSTFSASGAIGDEPGNGFAMIRTPKACSRP